MADHDARNVLATSFGAEATAYEAGRPSYPDDAVAWLLADRPRRVVDVGAGTGKLTKALVAAGCDVVAVDPDPVMLTTLAGVLQGVEALVGSAEDLPLDDGSADLVVFGQAWHWVDPAVASGEVARVLRPGGTLGLVWNIRDESLDWVAEMSEIMHHSAAEQMIRTDRVEVGDPFGPLEHATFSWARSMTRGEVLDMVRSRSYVITAPADERSRIETDIATLLDDLPEPVELPYVTHCYRVHVVPGTT